MPPIPEHPTRRRNRSRNTQVATTYQLDHVRQRFGFLAVALADLDGFCLAGSTEACDPEAVAAYAAAIARADERQRRQLRDKLEVDQFAGRRDLEVRIHEFGLDHQAAYLVIVAKPSDDFERAATHTIEGVKRIFATT